MNLMKLFNINYLLQNLKKSRTVLAIFIGLVPILNTIIMLIALTSDPSSVLSFETISYLNIPGIYFLPVIISICLFSYVYKKKSVDFINSMPISRKSLFITNTILGILILISMLLINIILICFVSIIFNSPIPFMMLFDYFWFFSLVYIFVFCATNLAMTISGNVITQIVVTLLLLFLVPYTDAYIKELYNEDGTTTLLECNSDTCTPEKYYCYDNDICLANKEENKYNLYLYQIKNNTYTIPFNLFYDAINYKNTIINSTSAIKMLILTILYIIIGYISFIKRKMEVSETSFKNLHIHNLVKSLTLIPVATLAYAGLRNESFMYIVFIVIIMLIYYFVYDLITKKSITNIKLSSIYFLLTIIVITTICSLIDKEEEKKLVINYNDIKEVAIELENNSNDTIIYTDNKELISLITKSSLNTSENPNKYLDVYLKTTNNKEYNTQIDIDKETYTKILSLLENEKKYTKHYKDINFEDVYALQIGTKLFNKEDAQYYLDLIKNIINNLTFEEFMSLQKKYLYNNSYNIYLYTYDNHRKKEFTINAYINYDLLNAVVNLDNQNLSDNISKVIPNNYYLYYGNSYFKDYYTIDYYVIECAKNELYNFVYQNISDKVDMRKEYFTFSIELNNNTYYFTTNKVEEIKKILDKKYEEIKNTNDYKEYYGFYTKEDVEYYD